MRHVLNITKHFYTLFWYVFYVILCLNCAKVKNTILRQMRLNPSNISSNIIFTLLYTTPSVWIVSPVYSRKAKVFITAKRWRTTFLCVTITTTNKTTPMTTTTRTMTGRPRTLLQPQQQQPEQIRYSGSLVSTRSLICAIWMLLLLLSLLPSLYMCCRPSNLGYGRVTREGQRGVWGGVNQLYQGRFGVVSSYIHILYLFYPSLLEFYT